MIKQGNDHFEVTRQEPKVEFCENKYVFDPAQPPNSSKPLLFNARRNADYVIPDEIADAVREKQQQDAADTAKLVSKGTPVARLNTGIDGGMNKVFAAKLPAVRPACRKAVRVRACRCWPCPARPAPFRPMSIRRATAAGVAGRAGGRGDAGR